MSYDISCADPKVKRERVAEAICVAAGDSPYNWYKYLREADAAIEAAED